MKTTLCLVAMRVGSTRLPYKHFKKIGEETIADLIHSQLAPTFGAEAVVYCLPDTQANDILAQYLMSKGREVARGDEHNVLSRLQSACAARDHEWIARVNGDNVIIIQDLIAQALHATERTDIDTITNVRPRSYPKGCSIELTRRAQFLAIDAEAASDHEKEHVFPAVYNRTPVDRLLNLACAGDFSDLDVACDDFRQLALLGYVLGQRPSTWHVSDLGTLRDLCARFAKAYPFSGRSGAYTIAEVGGNHEGDFEYAKRLVSLACSTSVDAVKLQVYTPDLLVNPSVDPNRHAHFKRFALKPEQYRELFSIIRQSGKHVSASVWSTLELAEFQEALDFIKIGSGDLTDALMLDAIRDTGKPVILSTGLSTMAEIEWAMARLDQANRPLRTGLLQCTSMYPIPDMDSNLLVMQAFRQRFGCILGYSDHTVGAKALELSVAAGARIQEFHFTDSREGKSFRDHFVSLTPDETESLIQANIKTMTLLGTDQKAPAVSELVAGHTRSFRKGVYLKRDMRAGEVVRREDLITLRPEAGISASRADDVIGRTLLTAVAALAPLDTSFFAAPEK